MVTLDHLGLSIYGSSYGLLGTDALGQDLFAQILWGSRVSLFVGLLAAFIGIALGLVVGLVAGYKTGLTDEVLMRFTDMMLVIPALPLLLVLIGVLGPSLLNIIILIGFLGWMGFARVIRSQVLSLKERPFVEAAKAAGAGTRQILTTHVFPNVVSLTYVNLALAVPTAILTEAALSFLGLGDPTSVSWGQILHNAESFSALSTWWWVVPPGIAIAIVSLSFILIGYALDEIFNPKLRRRR
jgi:peptide/nickel transport system permease protein